MPRDLYY